MAFRVGEHRDIDTSKLDIIPIYSTSAPNAKSRRCSVSCLAVRPADNLICTGHDESCEVVFWKWLPECPTRVTKLREINNNTSVTEPTASNGVSDTIDCGSHRFDEGDLEEAKNINMMLRPLRRMVSRMFGV